jgi:hypothetical protein
MAADHSAKKILSFRFEVQRVQSVQIAEPLGRFVVSGAAIARTLEATMHGIIYLIGLIVVIMAILSFFGLR